VLGHEDWLQPNQTRNECILNFFAKHFSFYPFASDATYSSTFSSATAGSDEVCSVPSVSESDHVPSAVSKQSVGSTAEQERRNRVRAFLTHVFPAVKGAVATAITEEQRCAAVKRKKIMELLGLVIVKRKDKRVSKAE
jgi:hypothetical protein